MTIVKCIRRLLVAAGILALAAEPTTALDRVSEVCVVAGDIDYCAPQKP